MDLSLYNSYKYIYIYLLSIIFLGSNIFESRDEKIINFFPFFFLFIGVFSGTNLYFWFIPFAVIGVKCLLENSKVRGYFYYVNLITFFWSFQAMGESYYLKPDKIRGLSLTSYNFLTTFVWSYLIFLIY